MTPELAALAVHDLKNALGVLDGQLETLESDPSPARARAARQHCAHLRRELVAFLTLYRGEALRAVVDDESPRGVLEAAQRQAQAAARVTVDVDLAADVPAFWYFDARLVRLALDAALHNACRYARTRITLGAALRGADLVLSVDDDGPGLAAEATGDAWSTGLGTELCRAVARAHELQGRTGEVRLFDLPGGGARFELVLP
jgi:signal transduction histidine kinase